jgi:putative ABC transport system substrate-binding protein
MHRRDLILGIGGAALIRPRALRAQRKAMPVIGILGLTQPDDPAIVLNLDGLRQGLKRGGFAEGQNVTFEYRWARGDEARLPALAAELAARRVDVIVTEGGGSSASVAAKAISDIPVVFHTPDAIADGIVSNLARPGGNLTGVSLFAPELLLKQFALLRELIPQTTAITLLVVPRNQIAASGLRQMEDAARAVGVKLQIIEADLDGNLEATYTTLAASHGGMVVRANASLAERLPALAARYAVPAIYNQRAFAVAGGLLSYGASIPAVYVLKGLYTAKVLSGTKPGDLPVQQPTKFEMVINLKTARALGLTVPQLLLAQADEVIE